MNDLFIPPKKQVNSPLDISMIIQRNRLIPLISAFDYLPWDILKIIFSHVYIYSIYRDHHLEYKWHYRYFQALACCDNRKEQ